MTPWTFQPRSNPFSRLKIGARSAAWFTRNLLLSYWLRGDIPVVYQRKKPFILWFLHGFDRCGSAFAKNREAAQNRLVIEQDLLCVRARGNAHYEHSILDEFGPTDRRESGINHLGPEAKNLLDHR
jgi:hypothetical protein